MSVQYYEGIGRRKESRARVRLMGGSGRFMVNEKEAAAYFTRLGDLDAILAAFKACGQEAGQYDVSVSVDRRRRVRARPMRCALVWLGHLC